MVRTEGTSEAPTGALRPDAVSTTDVEEQSLLLGLRQGSDVAFERLVRKHGFWMLALATRLLGSPQDAQDVVQESFLTAFRALPRFRGESRLSTWLRRIVVNHSLVRMRTRRRRPEQSLEALLPDFLPDGHSARPATGWEERPDDLLAREEMRELVRRCIDELPETYRTVLLLRDIEEIGTRDVAELLNVTPSSVKVRLHRARQALLSLLDPHLRRLT